MKNYMIIILCLLGAIVDAATMRPGLWTSSSSFKVNGIQLPVQESQGCVTADDTSDVKSTLTSGLKKDGCELTGWSLKGINLETSITCKNKSVKAKGNLKGTVTEKSYNIEGKAKGTYKNAIPAVATLKLTGAWISKTCK